MSLAQRMHFLLDVFQITVIELVSVINHYHINELNLFSYIQDFWCTISLKRVLIDGQMPETKV